MLLYVLAADERGLDKIRDVAGENAFIIAQASYRSALTDGAQIVFPSAIWSEQSGSLTNTEGRVQKMNKSVEPAGEARADWEVLSMLARQLGMELGDSHDDIFAQAALSISERSS